MRSIKILFAALLVFVSLSQIGATGFVPNMFVAQKQLNQPSSAQPSPQKEVPPTAPIPPTAPKKENSPQKDGGKEIFKLSGKQLKPEMSDSNLEVIEVDSIVSALCKSLLQWVLVYVISLV